MASTETKGLDWLTEMPRGRTESSVCQKLTPYSIAILSTVLALVVDLSLEAFAAEATDALYIMAAVASTFCGGWRFGLFSIVLGLLPNFGWYNNPHYSLSIGVYGWEHIIVTSAISAALVFLVGRLRSQQRTLQTLNRGLEDRVHQRTADLEESNRQLEAFCYTLAHDLRAPLRAIQGFSQITLAENAQSLSADGQQTLSRIGNSAEMMGRLIYDLLSYTQLHRGEIPLAKTNLQEVLDRVLQILAPEIREKKAAVEVVAPLPAVTTNFTLIEQIFLGLLSNALKFTRQNVSPRIRVWAETADHSVHITIQDNGVGIAPQHLDRVFQPFQRLEVTQAAGTGMGLALTKKAVERLGGSISVASVPEEGTRFCLSLPK